MGRQGDRIHLSVSKEVKRHIVKRKDFNASKFFETRYRETFLNEVALREQRSYHASEIEKIDKQMEHIEGTTPIAPSFNPKRCPICTMFFHENISIRQKTHIYRGLYVCQECSQSHKDQINTLVKDMKKVEPEAAPS